MRNCGGPDPSSKSLMHDMSPPAPTLPTELMSKPVFTERRKRPRVALHWRVQLKALSWEKQVIVETQNLSSEGFYCLCPRPVAPGEALECLITLPPSEESHESRVLSCRGTVLRLEPQGESLFGLACHIDDYSLSHEIVQ